MRDIKNIVLHCTATAQTATIPSIVKYWKDVMKWKTPGYHFLIRPDGTYENLVPIETPSNGVAGHNKNSIHISYIGGIDSKGKASDNRTPAQKETMIRLIKEMKAKFPHADLRGHRDFPGVTKECPSFDVKSWANSIGL